MTGRLHEAEIYIGLMSGTSADGMDAAVVRFQGDDLQILGEQSLRYPPALRQRIRRAASEESLEVREVLLLDRELGRLSAQLVQSALAACGLTGDQVRAVGSHGQTIRHLPEDQCTWQIGDANLIAQLTGLTTVADLRRRDLAANGQGAPLAPAFHEAAFRSGMETRVIVNLGGIANITLLPADPAMPTTGYDTGPANRLLDYWCQARRQLPFDAGGQWAATGSPHESLLADLLSDDYFSQKAPKSTGPERFNSAWLGGHLAAFPELAAEDVQATLAELTAISVAQEILRLRPCPQGIYLCGGGTENAHLVERIRFRLGDLPVTTTAALQVPPHLVEPVAFAWLARRTMHHQAGNLPAVTGATQPVILGAVYPGNHLLAQDDPAPQK